MDKVWVRWLIAMVIPALAFLACWSCVHYVADTDNAVSLGWAALPLAVIGAPAGFWATRVGKKTAEEAIPANHNAEDARTDPAAVGHLPSTVNGRERIAFDVGDDGEADVYDSRIRDQDTAFKVRQRGKLRAGRNDIG